MRSAAAALRTRFAKRPRSLGALRILRVALLGLSGACAAPGSDIHLAPLVTRISSAGGGTRSEALAGMWTYYRAPDGRETSYAGLRPFVTRFDQPDGRRTYHFLSPLGYHSTKAGRTTSALLPFYYYQSYPDRVGGRAFDLISLPLIFWNHRDNARDGFGLFPFYADLGPFLTFEHLRWVLFPLYMRSKRNNNITTSLLWPIFARTRGPTVRHDRVFPLYGRTRFATQRGERFDRQFWLWPFFHYHRDRLADDEVPETKWMFFPFLGRTRRGSYHSTSVLWPLLGYSRDAETDFWALDFPWPLIRIQDGGKAPRAQKRRRFWPLYSHFETPDSVTKSYLWPFISHHKSWGASSEREAWRVFPFWSEWSRVDQRTGRETQWTKLWPLYQRYADGEAERSAFFALWPLQRAPHMTFQYGWLWEVLATRRNAYGESSRSIAGLYLRETDANEERRSIAGLWGRRRYREADPASETSREVTETSLLFGLLRWRKTEGVGRDWMRPAFPGPGWPPFKALSSEQLRKYDRNPTDDPRSAPWDRSPTLDVEP